MSEVKRDFVFIDESGNDGEPGREGASDYYMVNALHLTDSTLQDMFKRLNHLRYFHKLDGELKNEHKDPKIRNSLLDISEWFHSIDGIFMTSGYLDKTSYEGPYLHKGSPRGRNPKYFRNFIISKTLERHFHKNQTLSPEPELEIVIDRFIENKEDEENLVNYLRTRNLPDILHVVQVDSRYSDPIQIVDLFGRLLKAKYVDGWEKLEDYDFDFVEVVCLNHIPREYPEAIEGKK
ncbi:MAG: DUF3800 domain-containing protein [Candidatus Bipolaricaulia bacterium]